MKKSVKALIAILALATMLIAGSIIVYAGGTGDPPPTGVRNSTIEIL